MAKGIRNLSSWMEVAPAPIIFPTKPSNSPALETIREETAEEHGGIHISHKWSHATANVARFRWWLCEACFECFRKLMKEGSGCESNYKYFDNIVQ